MNKDAKIYVAGHEGLVGSALIRRLHSGGYNNIVARTIAELDLRVQADVAEFFTAEQPEYVFLAAAKVGGIHANNTYPAEFIYDNLAIEINVIHQAYLHGVKKLLFLGSSCIYPKLAPQPLKEEYLLTGSLEPTNEAYAIAKIAGLKICEFYNRQYGTDFISVMPTNLYGPNDNFDLETSHVLPALIRKFHEAKMNNADSVEIWGSGTPKREFLHVDDMADACVFLMENYGYKEIGTFVNIGCGKDITIAELAEMIKEITGFKGKLHFNRDKPDGTPQKLLDLSKMINLGWEARISLYNGIRNTYEWYVSILTGTH
jgi:GDP-L-fucose synthase